METRVDGIQSVMTETWVREDPQWRKPPLIRPVEEGSEINQTQLKTPEETKDRTGVVEPDRKELGELVGQIQNYLEDLNIKLSFKLHEETGDVVVTVINKDTGEVIRQIPPEELLELREKLEELTGVLLNGKV